MANVITIPRGATAPKMQATRRKAHVFQAMAGMTARPAQAMERSTIRRNVSTDAAPVAAPEPTPDIRAIMRENAQLRTDKAILLNHLKVYQMRYGVL